MENTIEFEIDFGNDEIKKVLVKKPTSRILSEADLHSSKIFAKLVREKDDNGKPSYMVRSQLEQFLKDIEIYSVDDIKRLASITTEIKDYEEALVKGGISLEAGREIAVKLRTARFEFFELMNRRAEYDKQTVEYYCENERFFYIVCKCLTFEDGTPVYVDIDTYKNDDDMSKLLDEPIKKLAEFSSSFTIDMEKKWKENEFFIKYGFVDDNLDLVDPETGRRVNAAGQFIDEDGHTIDDDGHKIDLNGNRIETHQVGDFFSEEPKVVVKKTRKKKTTKKKVSS